MKILYLPNSYCQQRQFEKPNFTAYPVLLAMEAEWHRKNGDLVNWGIINKDDNFPHQLTDKVITEPEDLPFLELPHPDRIFTRWWEYQNNGNFKYLPGTYIQSARDCWWHKCTFCRWTKKYPNYECRKVEDVINEIEECKKLGFKEIFDDSGTFPVGNWLNRFCDKLYHIKDIHFSCNMRLIDLDYYYLKEVGFRMLLFGLESANQETLDRINKGVKIKEAIQVIKKTSKAGLEPHVAVMFGYPWETDKMAIHTLRLVHYLLRKGYAKTAQASFYQHNSCVSIDAHRKYIRRIYGVWKYPDFWFRKIRDIHNEDDLKYLWRQIKVGLRAW